MTNIIKNASQGNRYTYASLSDIANQGYEIPKMTVRKVDGDEYVFYWDEAYINDSMYNGWVQGAKVVVPSPILNRDGKPAMNEAQLYGSALTYARRYTTLLALGLACEDDKQLESEPPKATDKQIEYVKKLYSSEEQARICEHYKVDDIADLDQSIISQYIASAKARNEKHNQQQ